MASGSVLVVDNRGGWRQMVEHGKTGWEEEDTVGLDAPDGYNELPAKVKSFFRYALENYEFEWLFKCDDDTYLELSRLTWQAGSEAA